jgi:glyoxalase family protein
MATEIPGIHHVTAICGDAQRNVDFYSGVLGLRLVKVTVNFDMPETYHLYYGDATGSPGTIVTFFAWPGARRGRRGEGQITAAAFAIPPSAVEYWMGRFNTHRVAYEGPSRRFDEEVLTFADPDGLLLELVARPEAEGGRGWDGSAVPAERAIQRFAGVRLDVARSQPTADLLTDVLGFAAEGQDEKVRRFRVGAGSDAARIDAVNVSPWKQPGIISAGSFHHIAWRTPSDAEQLAWRDDLVSLDFQVTPVRDRQYFHSIYFVEPGGILFEIATDPPGFTLDESADELGTHLKLPPWLENRRRELEGTLPPLRRPSEG